MQQLMERYYQSIVNRGLIDENTTTDQFIDKMSEELSEVKEAYKNGIFKGNKNDHFYAEVMDLIGVGINLLRHHNIDFIELFKKCIAVQEKRIEIKPETNTPKINGAKKAEQIQSKLNIDLPDVKEYIDKTIELSIENVQNSNHNVYDKTRILINLFRYYKGWHDIKLIPIELAYRFLEFSEDSKYNIIVDKDCLNFKVQ